MKTLCVLLLTLHFRKGIFKEIFRHISPHMEKYLCLRYEFLSTVTLSLIVDVRRYDKSNIYISHRC